MLGNSVDVLGGFAQVWVDSGVEKGGLTNHIGGEDGENTDMIAPNPRRLAHTIVAQGTLFVKSRITFTFFVLVFTL